MGGKFAIVIMLYHQGYERTLERQDISALAQACNKHHTVYWGRGRHVLYPTYNKRQDKKVRCALITLELKGLER